MTPLALIGLAALAAFLGRRDAANAAAELAGTGEAPADATAPDTTGGGLYDPPPGGVPGSPLTHAGGTGSSPAGPAGTGAPAAGGSGDAAAVFDSVYAAQPAADYSFLDSPQTQLGDTAFAAPTVTARSVDYGPRVPRWGSGDAAPDRVVVVASYGGTYADAVAAAQPAPTLVGVHTDVGQAGGFLAPE